jgi:transcriptional regulator with XRE-family HTH domain
MSRRGIPKKGVNWYIREWAAALKMTQTETARRCGWSKASASQIFNGLQDYSPKIVNDVAAAYNCKPWELLMHPDEAFAIRRMRQAALAIVADNAPPQGQPKAQTG